MKHDFPLNMPARDVETVYILTDTPSHQVATETMIPNYTSEPIHKKPSHLVK